MQLQRRPLANFHSSATVLPFVITILLIVGHVAARTDCGKKGKEMDTFFNLCRHLGTRYKRDLDKSHSSEFNRSSYEIRVNHEVSDKYKQPAKPVDKHGNGSSAWMGYAHESGPNVRRRPRDKENAREIERKYTFDGAFRRPWNATWRAPVHRRRQVRPPTGGTGSTRSRYNHPPNNERRGLLTNSWSQALHTPKRPPYAMSVVHPAHLNSGRPEPRAYRVVPSSTDRLRENPESLDPAGQDGIMYDEFQERFARAPKAEAETLKSALAGKCCLDLEACLCDPPLLAILKRMCA